MSNNEAVSNAQRAVNKILRDLERETGQLVERLEIIDIDITSFGDATRLLQRGARIELKRLPGTRWDG